MAKITQEQKNFLYSYGRSFLVAASVYVAMHIQQGETFFSMFTFKHLDGVLTAGVLALIAPVMRLANPKDTSFNIKNNE